MCFLKIFGVFWAKRGKDAIKHKRSAYVYVRKYNIRNARTRECLGINRKCAVILAYAA